MTKLRVVLDTNVLVHALEAELLGERANRRQHVARAVTAHVFNRHSVFVTDETLDELKRIVTADHVAKQHEGHMPAARRFYKQVVRCAQTIAPATPEKECKADASDTAFLRAVAGAKANFLITQDKHLLDEKSSNGARILPIWDFASEMMGVKLEPDFRFNLNAKMPEDVKRKFATMAQPPIKRDAFGRPKKAPPVGRNSWKSGPK